MKDFHCEIFDVSLRFSPEEIDQDALIKDAGIENKEEFLDEDGDFVVGLTFGAREETTDYHAHMRVMFFKEGKSRVDINYHDSKPETTGSKPETTDSKPPYSEDCAQWLGSFFKTDRVEGRISAIYHFDKSFSPTVSLPFPLVTSEKPLAGASVIGLALVLPQESVADTAIIQRAGDDTFLIFGRTGEINLKEFNLFSELEGLSVSVNSLVKKQDADNDN